MKRTWQQTSRVFNERAAEYDGWFENSLLFDIELAAIKELTTNLPSPRIELGGGPGRFAQQLDINIGIDPAPAALQIAATRNILGIAGIGENLPLQTASVGTLSILFALCFLAAPLSVFKECARVLRSDGILLVGFIPSSSSWGENLTKKKKQNHPFYRYADFKTIAETTLMLSQAGFEVIASRSTLLQTPKTLKDFEQPQPGMDKRAGFCVLTAGKQ